MATVEMDLSEYDKMMENKRLLEASLEKERALGARIKELEEEKRKALEDSAHKVTKINKTVIEEIALGRVDAQGLIFSDTMFRNSGMDPAEGIMKILRAASDMLKGYHANGPDSALEFLRNRLFTTVKTEKIESEYVDTSQSIKDLKREIASKEYDKARERVQTEMNERDRLKERISHLVDEKRRLEKELKSEKDANTGVNIIKHDMDELQRVKDELLRENEALNFKNQRADNHFTSLYNIINKEYGLFGNGAKIAELKKTIMSFKR